jgi:hypothetical protein
MLSPPRSLSDWLRACVSLRDVPGWRQHANKGSHYNLLEFQIDGTLGMCCRGVLRRFEPHN